MVGGLSTGRKLWHPWPSKHRGFGIGPTTLSCKKNQVTETAIKEPNTTAVRIGLQRKSMLASGESRKKATGRSEVLSAFKAKTRIGFRNVRTMYGTGKRAQVTTEMRRYNLHILGVSESRWTGSGKIKTNTGEPDLYSGRDDNHHSEGVAIILN